MKTKIEVMGVYQGANVKLSREVEEGENIHLIMGQLSSYLKPSTIRSEVASMASVSEAVNFADEILPMPQLNNAVSELPGLENAPHSYRPSEAFVEVLDANKSRWATSPRTVKEVQEQLVRLGVRGISNLQNFDSVARTLNGQGKVKREKVDGVYKYYR